MGELYTLGGDRIDPSDRVANLIAANSVYLDEDEMAAWIASDDRELTTADDYTADWLQAVAAINRDEVSVTNHEKPVVEPQVHLKIVK